MNSSSVELILGNSNKRFSGVTSTMLQVWPYQKERMNTVILGRHHLSDDMPSMGFWQLVKCCFTLLPNGRYRVFHARRNNEMIQALILKVIFRAKIKIVFTSTAQRYHSWLTRWLMNQMDGLVSTCTPAASYMHKQPDVIIPHGIDTQRFEQPVDRAASYRELGFPGKYGIGIFGRVRHQKGIDVLVDAALQTLPENEDFTVLIVGEISPSNEAFVDAQKAKVAEHDLSERIVFMGKQRFDDLPSLFQAMTITTALSRNEGYGLTVLEAMSAGSAVLASDAGAWRDIIEEGKQGFVVPCGDVPATAERLRWLMMHSDQLEQMGQAARKRVLEHYTIEIEAQRLCDFFSGIAASE